MPTPDRSAPGIAFRTRSDAALAADGVELALQGTPILHDVTVAFPKGQVTALVGPNGSGKSTLLRAASRLAAPQAGTVRLDGADIARLPTAELARRMAILPQSSETPPNVTVQDLVGYGRYPHRGLLRGLRAEDREAMDWAIQATDLADYKDRAVETLSGGERQRAWIAMALAQRTDLLLLDEPTTYLDLRHQYEVLGLVRRLNRQFGLTVVWVLHDLNQAAGYSDRMVVMKGGRIHATGAPRQVLNPATIRDAFGIEVLVVPHPRTGDPLCLPIESGAAGEASLAAE